MEIYYLMLRLNVFAVLSSETGGDYPRLYLNLKGQIVKQVKFLQSLAECGMRM